MLCPSGSYISETDPIQLYNGKQCLRVQPASLALVILERFVSGGPGKFYLFIFAGYLIISGFISWLGFDIVLVCCLPCRPSVWIFYVH